MKWPWEWFARPATDSDDLIALAQRQIEAEQLALERRLAEAVVRKQAQREGR